MDETINEHNKVIEYRDFISTNEEIKPNFVVTQKTKIISVSDVDTTSYHVLIKDTFKHKQDEEITPQVILHAIQTLVDETKNYLMINKINDVSPIVYLLSIHQASKIKEISKATNIKENIIISAFLKNTFEINFSYLLKEVLVNLCLSDHVDYEKVMAFLDKEGQENLKQLLKIK
mgnify:CR=1 FL=1